jgi:integrase
MAVLLTAAAVEKYRGKPKRREIGDKGAPGLYLIIQPSGAKSWAMRFRRPDGRPAKLHLGAVDLSGKEIDGDPVIGMPLSLAAARQLAATVHRDRQRDIDVVDARKTEKKRKKNQALADAANNFADLARAYVDGHAKPNTRRWEETARNLGLRFDAEEAARKVKDETETERLRRVWPTITNGLADHWSGRSAKSIDASAIQVIVDDARKAGIPGVKVRRKGKSAARGRALHSALSGMFGWLASAKDKRPHIPVNPLAGIEGPSAPIKRDRYLSFDEIRWFWKACDAADAAGEGHPYRDALRLLLLTGQRRSEVGGLRRDELADEEWRIPGERSKNRRKHIVPLAAQARALIPNGNSAFVFTTTGTSPISGWSKVKTRIDKAMLAAARKEKGNEVTIKPWRLHDLRRTAATQMNEIGIAPHIVEAVLNHISGVKGGVAGTYNHSILLPERRIALKRWADHVEGLVTNKSAPVIDINSARGKR